jgi:hypothetical protein
VTPFIGGLQVARLFYEQVVQPLLAETFPSLEYAAALLGPGSDVLGYDTPLSTDHGWGPRLQVFLDAATFAAHGAQVATAVHARLPSTFHGWDTASGPPGHEGVQVTTVGAFFAGHLGCDPAGGLQPADWLLVPQQTLLELTAGMVFHDGLGELTALRAQLAYYPRDLWLYLMAAQWRRVDQLEPFVGRTGDVGDEPGSMLIAASLIRDLMRLCFLIERRYAPYSKWFGTAFARLASGPALLPLFQSVLLADDWRRREARLADAYAAVITLHNSLGVSLPRETTVSPFYNRPYLVPHSSTIVEALRAAISDPIVRAFPICGSVDQLSDSTDLLDAPGVRGRLRALYQHPGP